MNLLADNKVLKDLKKKLSNNGGNGEKTVSADNENLDWMKADVDPVGEIDIEEIKKQAQQKKETVFQRAQDYYKRYLALQKLSLLSQEELTLGGVWDSYHKLQKANLGIIAEMKKRKKTDPQTVEQFCFNIFLCRINMTDPIKDSEVTEIFDTVVNGGCVLAPILSGESILTIHRRGRVPTTAEIAEYKLSRPQWRCFFYDDSDKIYRFVHIPSEMPGSMGQISAADKVLFSAINGMIKRYRAYREKRKEVEMKEDEKKIASIMSTKTENPMRYILNGVKGTYVMFLPGKEVNGRKIGKSGAGIVRVYDLNENKKGADPFIVMEPIDGAGSMASFAKNKGSWVALRTLYYYRKNKEIPVDKVKDGLEDFTLLVCRRISAAIGYANSLKHKTSNDHAESE